MGPRSVLPPPDTERGYLALRVKMIEGPKNPVAAANIITVGRVRADANEQLHAWNSRVTAALELTEGYAGREVIPPRPGGLGEWTFVTHFDSIPHLVAWRNGEARASLYDQAKPWLEDGAFTELAGEAAARFHVDNSVTEVFIEQVKEGREDQYRAWSRRIQEAQARHPGYQGGYTQPPPAGSRDWVTLLRFATVDDLNRWLDSPERAALVKEAEELVERAIQHRVRTSFPGWAPTDAATGQAPPDWKTTMLVLLGLYPIVCIEILYLMRYLSGLPVALANFIGNAISVVLVAYVTMPLLVRAMDWWLFPKPEASAKTNLIGAGLIAALFVIEIALFWRLF